MAEVPIVAANAPVAQVYVDSQNVGGSNLTLLQDAANTFADAVKTSTGAELVVASSLSETEPTVIIARADAWPAIRDAAGLTPGALDAYAIVTQGQRVYILGNSESGANNGVMHVMREWGFRWYAPSSTWHIIPEHQNLSVDLNTVEVPDLISRNIWYAYQHRDPDIIYLEDNYRKWAAANRLSVQSLLNVGHSFGNIITRNQAEFDAHPEYFATNEDGTSSAGCLPNACKFEYPNTDLHALVAQDRLALINEYRADNPNQYMASVDPSDGQGTCWSAECLALGTTSDRVFHFVNEVGKKMKAVDPTAWVGLYAYSSHRLPPNFPVESNVYVQVAMAFNNTSYTYPELVAAWMDKVSSIGLREYYGVEDWDWGLPGRARGADLNYLTTWIPYYTNEGVNAVNAETNANWGAQALGHYVATQLLWDASLDSELLVNDFLQSLFPGITETMRAFYNKMGEAPALRPSTLLPMFADLDAAWNATSDTEVRARLSDLMAYLVYVSLYRDFEMIKNREPGRNDAYYAALEPLMRFAWQIRHRDVVHYYALARRLTNSLPLEDGKPEFHLWSDEVIWKTGSEPTDVDIRRIFVQTKSTLEAEVDPSINYSRDLAKIAADGPDAGPSGLVAEPGTSKAKFRYRLNGFFITSTGRDVSFKVTSTSNLLQITVFSADDVLLWDDSYTDQDEHEITLTLPTAGTYPIMLTGNFVLEVPESTPFVFEASVENPAWIDYSGPHYFYVPEETQNLYVDGDPRLSIVSPGSSTRIDIGVGSREPSAQYSRIVVPEGTDGQVWRTHEQTRGLSMLLNVPPLLSFHRNSVFVPREFTALKTPTLLRVVTPDQ